MPFRRTQRVAALAVAVAALVGLVTLLGGGSPRDWLLKTYRQESYDPATGSRVLLSDRSVSGTAQEIRSHWKPAQQVIDPSGVFLRYHDMVVAVRPRPGGSFVHVDDERHGYARWYSYVGGDWGVGSPVSGVRGGGPGSGK